MSEVDSSPVFGKKVDPMDFPTALRQVISGKRITKLEWNNPAEYVFLYQGRLSIVLQGVIHDLIVTDGDLVGQDWIIPG